MDTYAPEVLEDPDQSNEFMALNSAGAVTLPAPSQENMPEGLSNERSERGNLRPRSTWIAVSAWPLEWWKI